MRMSIIYMTNDICNDLDFEEVNTIEDSVEAVQIAQILKSSYFAMMSKRNWPHLRKTIKLDSLSDVSRPTHLSLPSNVTRVEMLNYDCSKEGSGRRYYKELKWLSPDAFLRKMNGKNSDSNTVDIVEDVTGVELLIDNNKNPDYYTSFDDTHIVFDSYDKSVNDTLLASKCQVIAYTMPIWETRDDFIPDLPEEAFTALLEEAKSRAAYRLKQAADQKAEQETTRQQRWLSQNAWRTNGGIVYPNYGRKSRKWQEDATFKQG